MVISTSGSAAPSHITNITITNWALGNTDDIPHNTYQVDPYCSHFQPGSGLDACSGAYGVESADIAAQVTHCENVEEGHEKVYGVEDIAPVIRSFNRFISNTKGNGRNFVDH